MKAIYRKAISSDLVKCFEIRGATNDNSFSRNELAAIGITEESWSPLIDNGTYVGNVAIKQDEVIGFCFGNTETGEILVLAILAGHEGEGIGKQLLNQTSDDLFSVGHSELWLAATAKPVVRAYGFYRSVGWNPTQIYDDNGDEILRRRKI
ncbi:GNAT family N-acetyltransferase [Marinomonas spartinae]|uniref:GNAT family N-acetyltransferase n=1 Tax=Marinomonas spartinae TaxID=1792290 RepID=UPI0018F255DD|nr:GNAT family N-acetyltransferase [Marinomonas spartinae]MBJ7557027.1 GNAT family N-acetyltransferase [Marinomonas spartinae]